MIDWIFFPLSSEPPEIVRKTVATFEGVENQIGSGSFTLESNRVLAAVRPGLEALGFRVEGGKAARQKISVPVLYGLRGGVKKTFEADAWHPKEKLVLEVEAGRGVTNNQFLKDLFEACMMQDVEYLVIAVRLVYGGSRNFETVSTFLETLYASSRLSLPLKGVGLIGY